MKSGSYRGFTLVELLVVLAIIGILTSVVLVSLSTVNSRGKDSAVQADLDGVRTQAQFYYNANGGYGSNAALEQVCPTASNPNVPTDNVFSDPTIVKQILAADFANGGGTIQNVFCNVAAGGAAYAISAALVGGGYFCVDSTGVGSKTQTALGNNTSCP